eukprot:scaffold4795_cov95-Skeletonema_dohrnii-CCMP3373.AAC.4
MSRSAVFILQRPVLNHRVTKCGARNDACKQDDATPFNDPNRTESSLEGHYTRALYKTHTVTTNLTDKA